MFSASNLLLRPSLSLHPFPHSLTFPPFRPSTTSNPSSLSICSSHNSWIAQISEQIASTIEEGPIELTSSSITDLFATTDDPTPLQLATSVLLTGAITVFLFRSLRRRAKRAKELKFRSSGTTKSLKEEALESLKAVSLSSENPKAPPSPVQTLLGALTAGVIALILYKFATTVESSLNRQAMPENLSVRQITVTIRTIINGICYLATFVFGINSVGLLLYSGQLALNSITGGGDAPASSLNPELDDVDSSKTTSGAEDRSPDDTQ